MSSKIYYTLAIEENETYGHGDCGSEYHIVPIDGYHTDSKKYHPIFENINEAKEYKKIVDKYDDMIIVKLEVFNGL